MISRPWLITVVGRAPLSRSRPFMTCPCHLSLSKKLTDWTPPPVETDVSHARDRLRRVGGALAAYLEQQRSHAAIMRHEERVFATGRRHLANMMGLDPEHMTQADIDGAIAYLFPSGLSDPKAAPVMKPPAEILPKLRTFQLNDEGRPNHPLFFTARPAFYALMSTIGQKSIELCRFADEQRAKGIDEPNEIMLAGSEWISKDALSKRLEEHIRDEEYAHLLTALDHLVSLPYSSREIDLIMAQRVAIGSGKSSRLFGARVPLVKIENGMRMASSQGFAKRTSAAVTVTDAGTGIFTVNGQSLDEFRSLQSREILLAPLIVSDVLGKVDVRADLVQGPGGESALPCAVRHATALCLAALYPETKELLRLAGLLTRDPRKKERMKVNQPGARAKWIWKRR